MPFNKRDIIAQEYPELIPIYDDFLTLKEINEEKVEIVQHYLKHSNEQSLRRLTRLFRRIERLMLRNEKEENIEKKYVLILLNHLKEKDDEHPDIKKLKTSLKELSKLLSLQFILIHSDSSQFDLKSNFQEFIHYVLEEQKIINGDLRFLDGVTEHFKQKINQNIISNAAKVMNIGHRGARALYAENTIGSMDIALGYHVQMIEFDVQICKSGEIVVMHDYTIDRTTTGHGSVKELTWQYLSSLFIKETNGEKILTLEEVIIHLKRHCKMNIELKAINASSEETLKLAEGVIKLIQKHHISADNYVISSFNHNQLKVVRGLGSIPIAAVFEDIGETLLDDIKHELNIFLSHRLGKMSRKFLNNYFIRKTLSLGAIAMSMPMDLVNEKLITEAHNGGLKVIVWTNNNPYIMIQLIYWGADGIITDRPDTLSRIKNSIARGNIPNFNRLMKIS